MTYQEARYVAIVKRILGWIIFIPSLLSTFVSVINLAAGQHGIKGNGIKGDSIGDAGINAVLNDFLQMMTEMIKFNTPFLDFFWKHSPTPERVAGITGENISFFVIYMLIFVGLAMSASGLRMYRQFKFIKERIEDQMVFELAQESGITEEQLKAKIAFPSHSLFSQIFILYISPIIIGAIACFLFKLLGW
ncbi:MULTISPECIES: YniB family protein [Xenorhabdus]|uniref:YniB family protein n=1 Tax=Xenorhabdus TaxID=626 RepID=UPI0006499D2A|nr:MULTISPECIES: YniB family protein [Xenorhabdus]KLU14557.1 membrane protein [Xenorhabdus griffiniae]KOP32105.1 membrane protein [Xenorhabdus sp. GDc328]